MGDCPTSVVLLGFLEDELPPSAEERVAVHMRACPGCQAILDQLVDDLELRQIEHGARHRDRLRLPEITTSTLRQNLYALGPMLGMSGERERQNRGTGFPLFGRGARDARYRRGSGGPGIEGEPDDNAEFPSGSRERPPADSTLPLPLDGMSGNFGPDQQVGRFRLRSRIGAGSCGVVYLADDTLLNRQVALKLPRVPSLVDPDLGERFVREAQATASLHHPNIVPVYEAGQTGELCYLTTAYCSGPTLAGWLRDRNGPVAPETAALIVRDLADAVAHAHRQGILHRDIKPANVLLDAVPGSDLPFTPKLTDFGLARLLEADQTATASGVVFGTPRYMAPEQANGKRSLCGPATDVYSLGAILYELLCGRPPIEGSDSAETLLRLILVEPPPLRRLVPQISADLEAIARKCLEKNPDRRYATASELADDLRRFLDHVPTHARPQNRIERLVGGARRHPHVVLPCAAALAVAVLLAASTAWHNARLRDLNRDLDAALVEAGRANKRSARAAQDAKLNADRAAESLYVSDLKLAGQAWKDGDPQMCRELLERHQPSAGEGDQRGLEWHYLWNQGDSPGRVLHAGRGALYYVCVSPDGRYLAAAGQESVVRIYDAASEREIAAVETRQKEANGLAFSADGQTLVTAGDDGTLCLWDWVSRVERQRIAAHPERAYQVVIVPEESLLVSCGDDPVIRLWDLETGRSRGVLQGHERPVEAIALAPDGRTLASAGSDRAVRLWDLTSGKNLRTLDGHTGRLTSVAISPDGTLIASGGLDRTARLWEAASGRLLSTQEFLDEVQSVAFSSDGRRLSVGDRAGAIHVHELPGSLTERSTPLSRTRMWSAHDGRVYGLASSPDGRGLISAGADGQLHAWRARDPVSRPVPLNEPATDIAFVPESSRLVVATDTNLFLYEAETARLRPLASTQSAGWTALAVSPRGDRLAAGDRDGLVRLWELSAGTVQVDWRVGDAFPIDGLSFHPDGSRLAVVSRTRDEAVLVFDASSGSKKASVPGVGCNAVCFSPDGTHLAIAANNDVLIWDLQRGQALHRLSAHGSTVNAVAFASGGNQLVSVSNDRNTILWDLRHGGTARSLSGRHRSEVRCAAFAADGRSLVSGAGDGLLKIWHAAKAKELIDLPRQPSGCRRVVVADDGAYLACLLDSGEITVFSTGRRAVR